MKIIQMISNVKQKTLHCLINSFKQANLSYTWLGMAAASAGSASVPINKDRKKFDQSQLN